MVVLSPRTPDKAEDFQEALLDAGAPQRAGLTEAEHAAMVGASLAWPCPEALCQASIRMLQCNPAYRDAVQIMPVSMWAVIELACQLEIGGHVLHRHAAHWRRIQGRAQRQRAKVTSGISFWMVQIC